MALFPDRIEVTSPGGLPDAVPEETYLHGRLSIPRNPIVANVFFRLGYIEEFGTGIARINLAYRDSITKPGVVIDDSSITVTLPVVSDASSLTADQRAVLDTLTGTAVPSAAVQESTGLPREATIKALRELVEP